MADEAAFLFIQCGWIDWWPWMEAVCTDVGARPNAEQLAYFTGTVVVIGGLIFAGISWIGQKFVRKAPPPPVIVQPAPPAEVTDGGVLDHLKDLSPEEFRRLVASAQTLRGESPEVIGRASERLAEAVEAVADVPADVASRSEIEEAFKGLRELSKDDAEKLLSRLETERSEGARQHAREASEAARHLAALYVLDDIAKALDALRRAVDHDPENAEAWLDLGDAERIAGTMEDAAKAYERYIALMEKAQNQREIGLGNDRLGHCHIALGELTKAVTCYQTALDIARQRSEAEPEDLDRQRDLSVSYLKIGDVRVAQGDLPGPLTAYEAGLAIRETLASRDSGNSGWQRDLSVSHKKIGDVRVAEDDLPGALASYEAGLAIDETLASSDPGNTDWQRDLSVSHNKIGDVLRAQGDLPGALASYEAGLAIRETLSSRDPGNCRWRRDLSISHDRIGDVRVAEGDLPGALSAYEAGLAIRETLAARDPGNAEWQADLAASHGKIGLLGGPGAREHFEKALAILERLDAEDRLTAEQNGWIEMTRRNIADLDP